jgi:hypothetical protein
MSHKPSAAQAPPHHTLPSSEFVTGFFVLVMSSPTVGRPAATNKLPKKGWIAGWFLG